MFHAVSTVAKSYIVFLFYRKNRKKQNEQNKNNADALLKNEQVTQHVFEFNPHANRKAK
jgi:preprotein translocase subunit YajC